LESLVLTMKITKKARSKVGRSNAHTTQIRSTHAHKPRHELETWHKEFTTRTELKSLTQSIKCAEMECENLRMLSECLCDSSMRLGVPFIAPRQLEAVGGKLGRPSLPSVEGRTGQSGAPLDSPVRHRTTTIACPVRDCLPNRAQSTVAAPGPLAHWTLSDVHQTVRCPLPMVGAATRRPQISRPTVGDHWLTGQSDAPPDSPVKFSRTPLILFPRATSSSRMTHRTVWCTTGRSGDF
jgi:hypothetical protein